MAVSVTDLDLRGVSEGIGTRELSSVEATEAYLRRIEAHDGVLRAYLTVTGDMALAQAKEADAEIGRGRRRGPLHGVPIALKDLIAVAGVKMTSGSRVLADHVPARDAFITRRLKDAGAVLLPPGAIRGTCGARRRARHRAPPSRRRPGCARGRSAPTRAARSAGPPP